MVYFLDRSNAGQQLASMLQHNRKWYKQLFLAIISNRLDNVYFNP